MISCRVQDKHGRLLHLKSSFQYSTLRQRADWSSLTAYITEDFTGSSGSRLYDAISDSITRAAEGSKYKKALIVLSDGADLDSSDMSSGLYYTLADVIAYANEKAIPVFKIYYRNTDYEVGGYGKPEVMEQLAKDRGGKYYDGSAIDLTDVYQQISNLLTCKYEITYTSSDCPGDISLEVLADYYLDPPGQYLYGQDSGTITFLP